MQVRKTFVFYFGKPCPSPKIS